MKRIALFIGIVLIACGLSSCTKSSFNNSIIGTWGLTSCEGYNLYYNREERHSTDAKTWEFTKEGILWENVTRERKYTISESTLKIVSHLKQYGASDKVIVNYYNIEFCDSEHLVVSHESGNNTVDWHKTTYRFRRMK